MSDNAEKLFEMILEKTEELRKDEEGRRPAQKCLVAATAIVLCKYVAVLTEEVAALRAELRGKNAN